MQFAADVSFALLQISPDGKAPRNELMLRHAMRCTGASCRMLQIPSNFAAGTTQLRDSNSKRPTYGTPTLSHRGAFTKTCFDTGIYTYFYPGMVLHAHTFMRRCFYTGMLLHQKKVFTRKRVGTFTQMPLHSDAFTEECLYTHVRLHRASFDTNELLNTEYFTLNTLTQRCSSHRKTFVQRRLFRHIYFNKRDFCTYTFTERGFYTQVLLD